MASYPQYHKAANWLSQFKRLEGPHAPSTVKGYFTDVAIFVASCEERGLPPLPAAPETLCAFLKAEAVRLRPTSLQRRLCAIRKIHRLLGLPDPTGQEDTNLTIRRIRRQKRCRPRQAKGMTRELLDKCLAAPPDNPWGMRNRAMISLGYDLLARRSELIALMTDDVEARDDGTLRVIIRRSKSDQFGMGRLAFSSKRSARLVGDWLEWRGPAIEPLFCAIYQHKPINRGLGTTTVKLIVKRAAAAAGLPAQDVKKLSGHSLRVGAAQDLLCAGFDTAAIMRAGGWKSTNVLGRYLELAEHNVWA